MIAGDGLWQTNDSQIEDRVLYFDTHGDLRFGAYNNGPTNAGLKSTITSPTAYNDGTWHYVVGAIGAGGATLYVDGVQVASDPTMVDTSVYYGNWRVGGDALTGWASAPSNGYLAGIDRRCRDLPDCVGASHRAVALQRRCGRSVSADRKVHVDLHSRVLCVQRVNLVRHGWHHHRLQLELR